MRTLSKRCRYALRALYRLTSHVSAEPVSVSWLAGEEKISRKFLEAILVQLRNHRLVSARHGKNGGYLLAQHPSQITLGQILRAVDGPFTPLPCLAASTANACPECRSEPDCETRRAISAATEASLLILDQLTLAELERRRRERQAQVLNFEI